MTFLRSWHFLDYDIFWIVTFLIAWSRDSLIYLKDIIKDEKLYNSSLVFNKFLYVFSIYINTKAITWIVVTNIYSFQQQTNRNLGVAFFFIIIIKHIQIKKSFMWCDIFLFISIIIRRDPNKLKNGCFRLKRDFLPSWAFWFKWKEYNKMIEKKALKFSHLF